jgi:hypothetical protein
VAVAVHCRPWAGGRSRPAERGRTSLADYSADEWSQLLRGLAKVVSAGQAPRAAPARSPSDVRGRRGSPLRVGGERLGSATHAVRR